MLQKPRNFQGSLARRYATNLPMKMTHKEHMTCNRKKVGEITTSMLNGTVDYLQGAIKLTQLHFEAEASEDDKDFLIFTGIASEIDHLPIGNIRKNWSKKSLERHEAEILKLTKWAKDVSLSECRSLAKRYRS